VHMHPAEVVADGEEEGQVVSGHHQHRQDVQSRRQPTANCRKPRISC
jgi:hypothetical protein